MHERETKPYKTSECIFYGYAAAFSGGNATMEERRERGIVMGRRHKTAVSGTIAICAAVRSFRLSGVILN